MVFVSEFLVQNWVGACIRSSDLLRAKRVNLVSCLRKGSDYYWSAGGRVGVDDDDDDADDDDADANRAPKKKIAW